MNLEVVQKYSGLCKGKDMRKHENFLINVNFQF